MAGTHVPADPGGVIGRHLAIRERQVSLERELAIGVGRNRRQATLRNALNDIASFGLSRENAVAIARDMQQTVKNAWQDLFRRAMASRPSKSSACAPASSPVMSRLRMKTTQRSEPVFQHAGLRGGAGSGGGSSRRGYRGHGRDDGGGGDHDHRRHAAHHADRALLVIDRAFLYLLLLVHAKHSPESRLQHHICRALAASVKPVLEVLNFHDVGNFRLSDADGDCGQAFAYLTGPFVAAQRGQGLGEGFVEGFCRDIESVRGLVQIADNDPAGFQRHA